MSLPLDSFPVLVYDGTNATEFLEALGVSEGDAVLTGPRAPKGIVIGAETLRQIREDHIIEVPAEYWIRRVGEEE